MNVRILDISDRGLKAITDTGIIGFIRPYCIKDNTRDFSEAELREEFRVGQMRRARVKRINYQMQRLEMLSLKPEDL